MTSIAQMKSVPFSLEAEQSVLGGLMLDSEAWDLLAGRLTEQDFFRSEHRLIYRTMLDLRLREMPIDAITVSESLERLKELDQMGGLQYIVNLVQNTPTASNIIAYADIVRERSVLRQLVQIGSEITDTAYDPKGKMVAEILDNAEKKIFSIAEQGSKNQRGPTSIAEVLSRTVLKIDDLFKAKTAITGLASGFTDLDRMTTGMQASDLIIIAGRPSMGKTTFAMNIAEFVAMKNEGAVLVFSMEMPAESLAMRILASLGRIGQQRIRSGQLVEDDWPRLSWAIKTVSSTQLLIDDTGALSPNEIRARARRVAREYGKLNLIVIDYLQLMRSPGHADNRTAEISEISRSLKGLARELDIPIIALSQLNRGLEQRNEKRPVMSDLRESGAIEQDADLIIFIYRDEVYNKESPEKGAAEIIIGKQRNGPIGTVKLTFLGDISRFENYTEKPEAAAYYGSTAKSAHFEDRSTA
ncbi:MAG: replicative DNA helicase [Gammaproteobacteria bacterium]